MSRWSRSSCEAATSPVNCGGPGFASCCPRCSHTSYLMTSHISDMINWRSDGYPARRLALGDERRSWLALCQYTLSEWESELDRPFACKQTRPWTQFSRCLATQDFNFLVAWLRWTTFFFLLAYPEQHFSCCLATLNYNFLVLVATLNHNFLVSWLPWTTIFLFLAYPAL